MPQSRCLVCLPCIHFKCCCVQTNMDTFQTLSHLLPLWAGPALPHKVARGTASRGSGYWPWSHLHFLVLQPWDQAGEENPELAAQKFSRWDGAPLGQRPFLCLGLVPGRLASQSGTRGSGTSSAVWSNGTSLSARTHVCPEAAGAVERLYGSGSPVLPSASWQRQAASLTCMSQPFLN